MFINITMSNKSHKHHSLHNGLGRRRPYTSCSFEVKSKIRLLKMTSLELHNCNYQRTPRVSRGNTWGVASGVG